MFGRPTTEVYRWVVTRYLRPRAAIVEAVDRFAREHFGERPMLAVHVRGTDKIAEDARLKDQYDSYPVPIGEWLLAHPEGRIFLLTDSERTHEEHRRRYPDRVVATACVRGDGPVGIHLRPRDRPDLNAVEVLVDSLLAARCGWFMGHGMSNVSCMIQHLKDWPPDRITLTQPVLHEFINPLLYQIPR